MRVTLICIFFTLSIYGIEIYTPEKPLLLDYSLDIEEFCQKNAKESWHNIKISTNEMDKAYWSGYFRAVRDQYFWIHYNEL